MMYADLIDDLLRPMGKRPLECEDFFISPKCPRRGLVLLTQRPAASQEAEKEPKPWTLALKLQNYNADDIKVR